MIRRLFFIDLALWIKVFLLKGLNHRTPHAIEFANRWREVGGKMYVKRLAITPRFSFAVSSSNCSS